MSAKIIRKHAKKAINLEALGWRLKAHDFPTQIGEALNLFFKRFRSSHNAH